MRPPCARRVAEPSATLRGVARAPAVPGGLFRTGLVCPPLVCLETCTASTGYDPGGEGMLRVRRTRSSLLAPALLVELAAMLPRAVRIDR